MKKNLKMMNYKRKTLRKNYDYQMKKIMNE